jgi:salicylate hydroxylase
MSIQDPLEKWHNDRLILIGDAAHAMLPTQGQGASQAIEDAEALGSFFENITDSPSSENISKIFEVRIFDLFKLTAS